MSKPALNLVVQNPPGEEVNYIKLHSEYFVLGLGPIPTTLTAIGTQKYPSLKMYFNPSVGGVICTAMGVSPTTKTKEFKFIIPTNNIVGMTFA